MHSIHESLKMERLRGGYVIIALLLFSLGGAARELPAEGSAPPVLVRIIPIPGVIGRLTTWPWIITAAGCSLPFMATTVWRFWILRVARETRAFTKDSSSRKWWRI